MAIWISAMDIWEIIFRLGAALLVGALIGLNRERHHKPAGVRTLGLVSVGSAVMVMTVAGTGDVNALSRVIQGLLTGIGFLGAGLIVRRGSDRDIHGLTTATCSWVTAGIGAACGAGEWKVVAVAVPLIFAVLLVGGPLERELHPDAHKKDGDGPTPQG
jgi:putative Mg2+ transporter-C (MgtC) family protein